MGLLLLACTTASPPSAPPQDLVTSARYTWTLLAPTDATPGPQGGWGMTTDQGFEVELHTAELVAYSVWLDPCPRPRKVGLLDGLLPSAWAGHSVMSNPTASRQPVVVDLTVPGAVALDPIGFAPDRFCKLGALHARGDRHTGPDGHGMAGATLHLVGTWRTDSHSEPFDLRTPIAHSAGTTLDTTGEGPHLEVEVRQSIDGLFDGIDFHTTPGPRVLRAVLANLVDSTELVATRTPTP